MSTPKWTPGPWRWQNQQDICRSRLIGAHGEVLDHSAYEGMWFARYDDDEDAANANLIAAAPELYEALDNMLSEIRAFEASSDAVFGSTFLAEAAMAKARGETEGER